MESQQQGTGVRWSNVQAYALAAICLVVGIALGYLIHGPARQNIPAAPSARPEASMPAQMPTADQMKHMADKKAEPLLEKLKQNPNDAALLTEIAKTYFVAHQFQEAIGYAEKSVQADPKQVGTRADLASYYFYAGESDKAIATLEDALKVQPNNAQVLFNLGLLKLQAKDDRAGAVSMWKQLLKTNPDLPQDRRQAVQQAIASASAPAKAQRQP